MKHNDKALQSDNSARLDALLSDFLNKEIVVPSEQQSSSNPTSAPLGDLFADIGSAGLSPEQASSTQTPATQKVAPVNRTDVWESTNRTGSLQSQPGLENLAADRLEKEVSSVLQAAEAAGSGKKLLLGSVAIILVLAAGLLIWQSRRPQSSEQPSEDPTVHLSSSDVDPPPPSTEAAAPPASVSEGASGPSEAVATNPSTSSHEKRPVVPVLVPESSAAYATKGVSQSIAQNAAKLQRMPAPILIRPNVPLGAIQDIPTFQSAQPPAPLPLPPNPVSSPVRQVAPETIRTTTATPALPVTKVQPIYPELAKRMKVTGTVRVAIVVDTTGKVISAKAVDGATVLRGSAELAVKQWRFKPATMNGTPVTGNGTVSVVFNPDRH